MHTTAHPDDENNGLLVMLNRGQGYRTALATATRGNGGQNEIGPEIFEALGVLRTGELAALHRFDGAEQYFTRAVDFGYSFSIEETFEKWGRDEITADYVRLIRMIRPDVIITLPPTGNAGGQHHMASAVITRDAYKLAGDPTKFPEQIKEGLRPWQPKKLYHIAGFGFPGEPPPPARSTRVNSGVYDPLLGKTYNEIGTEARSMHKCQGMGQLLVAAAPAAQSTYQLVETTIAGQMQKDETSLFDGVDTSVHEPGEVRRRGRVPKDLDRRPRRDRERRRRPRRRPSTRSTTKRRSSRCSTACSPFARCAASCAAWRSTTRQSTRSTSASARRKASSSRRSCSPSGIKIEVLADDGVVVPGQPVKVNVIVANRGAGEVAIKNVKFDGFEGDAACEMVAFTGGGFGFPGGGRGGRGGANAPPPQPMSSVRKDQVAHCEPTLTIPADARVSEPYWHREGRGRALHVRRGRAVRPADAADAVLRPGDARAAGRRRGDRGAAGAAPLRRRHLQRREADRAAGRAGVVGPRHAGDRDHSGGVDPAGSSRRPAGCTRRGAASRASRTPAAAAACRSRGSRDGRQRHAGRGRQRR